MDRQPSYDKHIGCEQSQSKLALRRQWFILSESNDGYATDYIYDAAGRRNRLVPWVATVALATMPAVEFAYEFDGNGQSCKQLDTRRFEEPEIGVYTQTTTSYYLHS